MSGQKDKASDATQPPADTTSSSNSNNAAQAEASANADYNKIQQLFDGLRTSDERDMSRHKFWATQPVPSYSSVAPPTSTAAIQAALSGSKAPSSSSITSPDNAEGPISPADPTKVRQDPYPLIDGFEWVTMDMTSESDVSQVYNLLFNNYVEDAESMFRFKYSPSFLDWALKAPGWRKEWHIGIRATTSKKLVGFVSGIPVTLRIRDKKVQCSEVNFLNVHKKLRSKRLAPVLIREITRRCNQVGIWQAIYTSGTFLPTPVSTCRYFHRALDWPKLHDVQFSPLPPGSTKQRQVLKYKLPERTSIPHLRPMKQADVPAVQDLLQRYLDRTDIAQDFSKEDIEHWFLNADQKSQDKVVWTYVVEKQGKITDFFSFYCLESTIIGHPQHDTIRAAYLFYYATETAFQKSGDEGKDKEALKKRLNELVHDALIIAKNEKFDVFNALSLMDNPLFLQEQRFGAGDGRLHYYLYNYRTPAIGGGVNESNMLDEKTMGGVGVVML